ncbi:TetR/AcrR family transcriptional regulator [Xenorhabdus sp. XENO-10]|uniref:TetR/AcrR family transcriptional regulator n=1 Tax=Xenorhabdus yunnanensis TaxID=3025878 RepID=A0ABT5LCN1_9GAMM|nr:TetR/AcrR family transcriptional regulator [Xenorhabdus yunnanensis]MDC9588852.1 TetR/AcrR family transcriptional regulator [Xenorhabdus yunnanensis]
MKSLKTQRDIIKSSLNVFIRKGYSQVTMTDIINECGISRGGVYRYFQSTKEIFIALIRQINSQQLDNKFKTFSEYLEKEKNELLNIRDTIRVAGYEFMIQESQKDDSHLACEIYQSHIQMITQLTGFDQKQAEQVFLVLEGLTVMALTGILTNELIENHFNYLIELANKRDNHG